jgi:transcriptional regulator with XRE-family HTH domain
MASKQKNIVGPQVRRLRVAAGLSQEALANRLQVAGWDLSRAGLSKIEAGLRLVIDAEVVVLARVLGVALDELVPRKARGLGAVLRHGRG